MPVIVLAASKSDKEQYNLKELDLTDFLVNQLPIGII
jgi:hypothetical protein